MIHTIPVNNILFIDIETVPQYPGYNDVPESIKALWSHKCKQLRKSNDESDEELYSRAGIYAEFGKVICIVVASINPSGKGFTSTFETFTGDNESQLLNNFCCYLDALEPGTVLCGHNIKEFDIPYLCRRILVNEIPLPEQLWLHGRKPWEVQVLDTMELWKFGDYKHYTPLNLLAASFGLPNPKEEMEGSMVGKVYWEYGDLEKIERYCCADVDVTMRLFLKLAGKGDVSEKNTVYNLY